MPETKSKTTAIVEEEAVKKQSHFVEIVKRMSRDPKAIFGVVVLGIFVLIAIFGEFIAPYNPNSMTGAIFAKPFTPGHIFGTDHMGRDLFSRVIIGTRYSITLGVGATMFSLICGMILGSIAGFVGGWFDEALMRVLDVIQSIPGTLFNMALATAFGAGFWNLMIAMGVSGITGMTRLQRSCILSIRKLEYIDAASATNCSFLRIVTKHVIPNAFAPTLVQATMRVGGTIMAASGLSFLGCGVPLSIPEWGSLLSGGRDYLKNDPFLCIIPGIFLVIFVLAINLFGDGLRDAMDPKLKK